jgi:hypothetical protein
MQRKVLDIVHAQTFGSSRDEQLLMWSSGLAKATRVSTALAAFEDSGRLMLGPTCQMFNVGLLHTQLLAQHMKIWV